MKNAGRFRKNHTPWNKGKKHSAITGQKHVWWKGETAKYGTKHAWVYRHMGTPSLCDNCGDKNAKRFDWHNISGKYLRSELDWIRLCTLCHYDVHAKIKNYQIPQILHRLDRGEKQYIIALELGVDPSTISKLTQRKAVC